MASEEVNKILDNLYTLRKTKLGEGDKKEDEAASLKKKLEDEMKKREDDEKELLQLRFKEDQLRESQVPIARPYSPQRPVQVQAPVQRPIPRPVQEFQAPVQRPVQRPEPEYMASVDDDEFDDKEYEQSYEQNYEHQPTPEEQEEVERQIIARSVEVLNNDGIYRHAMLEKMTNIERHLHMIAVSLVKLSNLDLEHGKE